jgi:hypothetical protein
MQNSSVLRTSQGGPSGHDKCCFSSYNTLNCSYSLMLFKFLIRLWSKPILEITLSPLDTPRWSDRHKITDLTDSFLRNGFEPAGTYECREIPSLIISGFVRPSDQTTGVIYDHPTNGIWVDVYVHYADEGSLTVSNAATGHELDHMPQQTKVYCKGSSIDELLGRVLSEREKSERVPITKEGFASHFEGQYQKEMKWRIDRGGPTTMEVMLTAQAMGESLGSERLQTTTENIGKTWLKEKNKPRKMKIGPHEPGLPGGFVEPETFRRQMERQSAPIPQLNVPALPVYLAFTAALAYWCYFGYQYNEAHFPVSLTALVVFFLVFLLVFLVMMAFREYHRRVRMYPLLKHMADLRPGAFLVITATSPSLFYAREGWIGKVSFIEGSETENACTRLDAVVRHSMGSVSISRKTLMGKLFSDKEAIPLSDGDFGRKFTVFGTDKEFAETLLNRGVSDAILRLEEFGKPFVEIEGTSMAVEIGDDLSSPRKEAILGGFLEEAERIIDATVRP